MKIQVLGLVAFASASAFAAGDPGFVHHPAPSKPVFIDAALYDTFKSKIPAPPSSQSPAQLSDEAELFRLQETRTMADCEIAKSEVRVSLQSFYGSGVGILTDDQVKLLTPFFNQLRNDGDYFVQKMKVDFPRQRPFNYIPGIQPCVAKEVSKAYPSGHAMLSRLYGLVLADLFPSKKAVLEFRAREIGKHRVLAGMHHPTDIQSGRALAEMVYAEMKQNGNYQLTFNQMAEKCVEK